MAYDYLKRLLDREGIEAWDLRRLTTTERGDVVSFGAHGSAAQDLWHKLREVLSQADHWPVILGSIDTVGQFDYQLGIAKPVGEVLAHAATLDAVEVVARRHRERIAELQEYNEGGDQSDLLAPEGEWPDNPQRSGQFLTPFNLRTRRSHRKVAIALVPTRRSWEVPAFLAFGGWNDCPEPAEHCAVLRRWNEHYGAEVACLRHDVIECAVDRPPTTRDGAMALAREQYEYCEDIVDQGTRSLAALAAELLGGTAWFFWWD